jgi:hypothetical protein
MSVHLLYRDDIETIELDEQETHDKIIQLMTEGMHSVRDNTGKNVRISHAKAFALLKGKLIVNANPAPELAQGPFAAGQPPCLGADLDRTR